MGWFVRLQQQPLGADAASAAEQQAAFGQSIAVVTPVAARTAAAVAVVVG